jgi:arylformamidase
LRVTDVTGPMYDGMWSYGPPYPDVVVEEIPQPEFIQYPTYSWRFELGAQSGTYLETSLHLFRDGPPLADIAAEELFMRDAVILRVAAQANQRIEAADLLACETKIGPGEAVIVATGWDSHWHESDFVSDCPFFSYEAMRWILDQEPFLFAGDMPRFDSWEEPQGFFQEFFEQGVLLLAPLVNLGEVRANRVKLVALPLKIEQTCAAPCRVLVVEDE